MEEKMFNMIPGMDLEEMQFLKEFTKDLREDQINTFISIYNGKRQKPDMILITALLGFFGLAGIHRFILGQIGMGILYLLTAGLCFIGTIVDLVNHKRLTYEYNQQAAYESMRMTQNIS